MQGFQSLRVLTAFLKNGDIIGEDMRASTMKPSGSRKRKYISVKSVVEMKCSKLH